MSSIKHIGKSAWHVKKIGCHKNLVIISVIFYQFWPKSFRPKGLFLRAITSLVRKTFFFFFFLLGFSVEFALFDYIHKVGFVVIILCVKCPLWIECMSVFFSELAEMISAINKIRRLLKYKGL